VPIGDGSRTHSIMQYRKGKYASRRQQVDSSADIYRGVVSVWLQRIKRIDCFYIVQIHIDLQGVAAMPLEGACTVTVL
jgi:hypothetical protein